MRWLSETGQLLKEILTVLPALSLLLLSSHACAGEITVSAAMSLKDTFTELGRVFEERHPGDKVVFNFGPSGVLRRQIDGGVPTDIFASASSKEMDAIERSGMIISSSRADFASNVIVLVAPADSRLTSFNDLTGNGVERIVIGNPLTTPFGMYSKEALKHFNLWDALDGKLVLAEHVRQALDYVARGEVDTGMVYSTDAMSRAAEVKVISEAPEGSHRPIVYPIAIIKDTENEVLAREFIATVTSDEGKRIMGKHGFTASP